MPLGTVVVCSVLTISAVCAEGELLNLMVEIDFVVGEYSVAPHAIYPDESPLLLQGLTFPPLGTDRSLITPPLRTGIQCLRSTE